MYDKKFEPQSPLHKDHQEFLQKVKNQDIEYTVAYSSQTYWVAWELFYLTTLHKTLDPVSCKDSPGQEQWFQQVAHMN